jgi:NitT/TauT family transport system substrate-binding protein
VSRDEVVGLITTKGGIFSARPQRTMIYADHMYKIGLIKTKPASWKDYFIAAIHYRPGS